MRRVGGQVPADAQLVSSPVSKDKGVTFRDIVVEDENTELVAQWGAKPSQGGCGAHVL